MEFLLGGAWGCFLHINSEYVKFQFGYPDSKAAAVASLAQVVPIFLMPFLGLFVDRYGKRTWMSKVFTVKKCIIIIHSNFFFLKKK